MINSVVPGERRVGAGKDFTCPQVFFDPDLRLIYIEGRSYPMERVHYFERAKMAGKPKVEPQIEYTIGKPAPVESAPPKKA